eukprot:5157372-Prymnesium_polylepis.1
MLGFGLTSQPGYMQIVRVELARDQALAEREADAFATDIITEEKRKNAAPPFVPLALRMTKHRMAMQAIAQLLD